MAANEIVRHVYKGKLLNVFTRRIRLPNGHTFRFETIRHPGAALVVPFLSRDKVILLRQLRPVIGKYIYELPAGTLGKGEAPRACARREIIEETGYAASSLTRLGAIYPVPGYSTERIEIFKATGLTARERTPENDEIIETLIVTRVEVRRLFRSGKITDAKTIAAFALCGWL